MTRIWDDIITERDRLVYQGSGHHEMRIGFGQKPALIVIDINYNFVGDKPEPIVESVKRFPWSCGEEGWAAVHQIASLLPLVRQKHIPTIYTTQNLDPKPKGWIFGKSSRVGKVHEDPNNAEIVREIAPVKGDIIIRKTRASMFFGTPIVSILNAMAVDTLLVCGGTTSGCVRASVVEALAHNFRVAVIEEGTFDRGQASHKVNLFDMNAKYADVVSMAEVKEYIKGL